MRVAKKLRDGTQCDGRRGEMIVRAEVFFSLERRFLSQWKTGAHLSEASYGHEGRERGAGKMPALPNSAWLREALRLRSSDYSPGLRALAQAKATGIWLG